MKVILLMAITADGMIARDSLQLVDWSGKSDKQYFVDITKKAGVMIMGSKTFDTIGRVLPERKNIVMTKNKNRISQDKNLIFTARDPEIILADLADKGFTSAILIGGAVINSLFMKKNLVDEVHLTVVPIFFGGGLNLFNESLDTRMQLLDVQKLGQTHVLLKYKIKK
ncbi:MAG: dihydrofolate reductase family protein [Desulfobacula sp.]|nr:dihydrofolate reductase family protein [Desulfobacula sp.]